MGHFVNVVDLYLILYYTYYYYIVYMCYVQCVHIDTNFVLILDRKVLKAIKVYGAIYNGMLILRIISNYYYYHDLYLFFIFIFMIIRQYFYYYFFLRYSNLPVGLTTTAKETLFSCLMILFVLLKQTFLKNRLKFSVV